jgi:rare lipoprotein A
MKNLIKIIGILLIVSYKVAFAGNQFQEDKKNQIGMASYYSGKHDQRRTASGEKFQSSNLTAAHKTLKFGTLLKVTNLNNNKSVLVTVNDRGPHIKGRIIDLSYVAAKEIDMLRAGTAKVKIEIIEFAEK